MITNQKSVPYTDSEITNTVLTWMWVGEKYYGDLWY